LRLILRRWEMSADLPSDLDEPESARARLERRIAAFDRHRIDIEAEMADLRTSAIWRLNEKIADAKRQGWDLFAEMVREVTREIRRAEARLAKIARARPHRSAAEPRPRVL
jgi:predicted phage gp36 major capsid-like protein